MQRKRKVAWVIKIIRYSCLVKHPGTSLLPNMAIGQRSFLSETHIRCAHERHVAEVVSFFSFFVRVGRGRCVLLGSYAKTTCGLSPIWKDVCAVEGAVYF